MSRLELPSFTKRSWSVRLAHICPSIRPPSRTSPQTRGRVEPSKRHPPPSWSGLTGITPAASCRQPADNPPAAGADLFPSYLFPFLPAFPSPPSPPAAPHFHPCPWHLGHWRRPLRHPPELPLLWPDRPLPSPPSAPGHRTPLRGAGDGRWRLPPPPGSFPPCGTCTPQGAAARIGRRRRLPLPPGRLLAASLPLLPRRCCFATSWRAPPPTRPPRARRPPPPPPRPPPPTRPPRRPRPPPCGGSARVGPPGGRERQLRPA